MREVTRGKCFFATSREAWPEIGEGASVLFAPPTLYHFPTCIRCPQGHRVRVTMLLFFIFFYAMITARQVLKGLRPRFVDSSLRASRHKKHEQRSSTRCK